MLTTRYFWVETSYSKLATPSAAERPGFPSAPGLAHARSSSSSALCTKAGDHEEQRPERNSLSLPEDLQSQADLSQEAPSQSNKDSGSSGFSSLNRPAGAVPAVPERATVRSPINRPEGVGPAHTSSASSAQQAEQAVSSEKPVRRIKKDRAVGDFAEYEQGDSEEIPSSAAAPVGSQAQEEDNGAELDSGQLPERCTRERPEKQGCEACLRKHQQLELANLEAKGLESVSIGRRKSDDTLQVRRPPASAAGLDCVSHSSSSSAFLAAHLSCTVGQ